MILDFDFMLWDLLLASTLIIILMLVIVIKKRHSSSNSDPSKTRFVICIIGKGSRDQWEDKKIDGEEVELSLGGTKYKGSVKDSWFSRYSWIGRRLNPEEGYHLLLFYEGSPDPIIHGEPPTNTAQQLMTAQRYRGVNPALRDQFTERSALDIPWWALVIALAVFIIVVLVVADKQGWLRMVLK